MILAQLSDPHLRLGDGADAAMEALAAGVAAVLALRPLPDAVPLSGDLADTAAPGEYERARSLLAPLPMPVHVLPGNHDDRAAIRAAFPLEGDGEYRYVVAEPPAFALHVLVGGSVTTHIRPIER